MSTLERFRAKVVPQESGCWDWSDNKDRQGYGRMRVSPRHTARAHRLAYELFWSTRLPRSTLVCHSCDNPSCVNPWHLFLGTPDDNMQDKVRKGRQSRGRSHADAIKKVPVGALNGRAKLTEDDARDVLRQIAAGVQLATIARQKGVTPTAIQYIKSGRAWKHIDRSLAA